MSSTLHATPVPARAGLSPLVWFGLIALLTAACFVPALINGTPPVFTDTQSYLDNMNRFRPSHMRAFGYGAFLRLSGGLFSLWLPVFVQALLSAWLVLRFLALEQARWPRRWRGPLTLAAVALLLAGPLPWLTSWLMPDLFAGLIVLALAILGLHWRRLGLPERLALVGFLCGAASLHLTHLLLGLALALGVLALVSPRSGRQPGGWRRWRFSPRPSGQGPSWRPISSPTRRRRSRWGRRCSCSPGCWRTATCRRCWRPTVRPGRPG